MVIKVYISGISGNKEVKKRQQRVLMILESKNIKYDTIDITEPGKEAEKLFMQEHATAKDSKHPLPPQIFNEDEYCGDYDGFDLANENDELEIFLKMPISAAPVVNGAPKVTPHEQLTSEETSDEHIPERLEEIINTLVPDSTTEKEDNGLINNKIVKSVHGFCYTPALAKRLEKAVRSSLCKSHLDSKPFDVDDEIMEEEHQQLDSVKGNNEIDQETKSEMEVGAEGEE